MRNKGKIVSWNDERGFGFIEPVDGDKQVFVHIKAIGNKGRRPYVGQLLTYALSTDEQGRTCAVKALVVGGQSLQKEPRAVLAITMRWLRYFYPLSLSLCLRLRRRLRYWFYMWLLALLHLLFMQRTKQPLEMVVGGSRKRPCICLRSLAVGRVH